MTYRIAGIDVRKKMLAAACLRVWLRFGSGCTSCTWANNPGFSHGAIGSCS
jgi:hypothetical protein